MSAGHCRWYRRCYRWRRAGLYFGQKADRPGDAANKSAQGSNNPLNAWLPRWHRSPLTAHRMDDPYPEHFELEIDRERLRRYLRVHWFLAWMTLFTSFGAVFGMASAIDEFEKNPVNFWVAVSTAAQCTGMGAAIGFGGAVVMYFVFSHYLAARYADALRVNVEGAFLRIRERSLLEFRDRRLHFRSIVDYVVVQGWLMRRFNIAALQMTTTGGGPKSTIQIPGVRDCLQVRDALSHIDRLREHQ